MAAQKEEFFSNVNELFIALFVMFFAFALFYGFGVIYALFLPEEYKRPIIWGSGAMNNSLAVGLSFAYFDAKITFFIVVSEIIWSVYVAAAQRYFTRRAAA